MTVYIDVLILLNIYVNYFLLLATAKLTHTKLKTYRIIISSVVGSLFSLTILLPTLNFVTSIILKFIAAAIIVLIAYGTKQLKQSVKFLAFFYGVNFIFAGVIMAIWLSFKPKFIHFNNSYFYIDFSLLTLVISTVVAYCIVSLIRYLIDRKFSCDKKYSIIFSVNNTTVSLRGIADSGNKLNDMFTGKSVIICNMSKLPICDDIKYAISEKNTDLLQNLIISNNQLSGFRIIPYSTIDNTGMIAVFRPKNIIIKEDETGRIKEVDALIGINPEDSEYGAIFNPILLT